MSIENPTKKQIQTWRNYLADEYMEAMIYEKLANKKDDEEKRILLELAEAEKRHAAHWLDLLGEYAHPLPKPKLKSRILAKLTSMFGSIFILAIMQRAEERAKYTSESYATPQMFADEQVHSEVVKALVSKARNKMSGNFRAAIFGMNDGIVSNLALILGVATTGIQNTYVLLTGLAGSLAGALSMAAGEYVSVKSQIELIQSSEPNSYTDKVIANLDVNQNELSLIFRARGDSEEEASRKAHELLKSINTKAPKRITDLGKETEDMGNALSVAFSSFVCFALGSLIPVLPYAIGITSFTAMLVASILSGLALILTGAIVGILSGVNPIWPSLRQLFIGYGAATVTVLLGTIFRVSL
ncbi:VIT1/CCC1 transporter family protein [Actinomyces sp. zg-332]|uniref:VIT1/CCC1 transporter family protein n=1 Tax=Actinomyces sp. zg-332 TaxID=2708340 RepID=UPI0014226966|nr:VIT1/CCC1 family protein [Actinomyces sp. zg-332]QPK94081.1 VIT1/CCC1 transporter family protein [Actinomyces sp. zg-332]